MGTQPQTVIDMTDFLACRLGLAKPVCISVTSRRNWIKTASAMWREANPVDRESLLYDERAL